MDTQLSLAAVTSSFAHMRWVAQLAWSAAAVVAGLVAWYIRTQALSSGVASSSHPVRAPADVFVLSIALSIGITIGLSLPFFIELTRTNIPASAALAHHATTKKYLQGTKFDEKLVDEVVGREELTVNCLGGRQFDIPITPTTTCGEIVTELKHMLDLSTGLNEYGLYVRQSRRTDSFMVNEIPVHSVMVHLEAGDRKGDKGGGVGGGLVLGDGNVPGQYHFVFNVFSFACFNTTFSLVEEDFMFERAFDAFLLRRLPCSPHTMLRLASLRCQCLFGDVRVGAEVPSSPPVHPVQIDGLFQPPPFESKALPRGAKKRGKVKSVPGSADRKMTKVEYDATMQRILDMWTSLQGVSSDDARRAFMDIVDEWPYSMHSIFDIQQSIYPDWPKDMWLLIGPDSVSFHEKYRRASLVTLALEDIEQFGGPYPNIYTLVTSGKQIDFETQHVQEIAAVMKRYCEQLSDLYQVAQKNP